MRAVLELRATSYVAGAYHLRSAWKSFETLIPIIESTTSTTSTSASSTSTTSNSERERVARSCLLFGVGIFYFFVSLVPQSFQWALRLIGFVGDREKGLQFLRRCADERGVRSDAALLFLIWIDMFFLQNLDRAATMLDEVLTRYETASTFFYLRGYLCRKRGNIAQATVNFQHAYDGASDVRQLQLSSLYELGWCQLLALNFLSAIDILNRFLQETKSASFRAFAAYQLGLCYALNNQFDDALKAFARVEGFVRPHFTYDQFAARRSKIYLESRRFTTFYGNKTNRAIELATIHAEALRFDDALLELDSIQSDLFRFEPSDVDDNDPTIVVPKTARDEEHAATVAYLKGVCYRGRGECVCARKWLAVVLDCENVITQERYLLPHASVECAEMALVEGRLDDAERFLKSADCATDYDLDKPLKRRIAFSFERLARLRKSE